MFCQTRWHYPFIPAMMPSFLQGKHRAHMSPGPGAAFSSRIEIASFVPLQGNGGLSIFSCIPNLMICWSPLYPSSCWGSLQPKAIPEPSGLCMPDQYEWDFGLYDPRRQSLESEDRVTAGRGYTHPILPFLLWHSCFALSLSSESRCSLTLL